MAKLTDLEINSPEPEQETSGFGELRGPRAVPELAVVVPSGALLDTQLLIKGLKEEAYRPSPAISNLEWSRVIEFIKGNDWSYASPNPGSDYSSPVITIRAKDFSDSRVLVEQLSNLAESVPGSSLDITPESNGAILTLFNVHRGEGHYFDEVTIDVRFPHNA